jgi:Zn-dependent peptidase ImmA (M78 family)/transcriptional regulator with XRE-family HTH domain
LLDYFLFVCYYRTAMKHEPIQTQEQLGARIAEARQAAGLTQAELASRVELDRTSLSRVETGNRRVDVVELAAIARALGRPVESFLHLPSPAVVSQREASGSGEAQPRIDALAEELASDVDLLLDLGVLKPPSRFKLQSAVTSLEHAEGAAQEVRRWLGCPTEPLLDLPALAERLALVSVAVQLVGDVPDGLYINRGQLGVAWLDGGQPAGRRRFTLAHELGHHLLEDEYRIDWQVGEDETERIVNAFAIHLLLPRRGVQGRWRDLATLEQEARSRAISIAASYGASWSATCAQLQRFELITGDEYAKLASEQPRRGEFVALGVTAPVELAPPFVSSLLSSATVRAHRRGKLSAGRALELLRGTLQEEDLPIPEEAPLDSFAQDLEPLD